MFAKTGKTKNTMVQEGVSMDMRVGAIDGEATPSQTWASLQSDPDSALVDVRSNAEWAFVGVPDLSSLGKQVMAVEWKRFPAMDLNPDFDDEMSAAMDALPRPPSALYFLCRSGVRSRAAAASMKARLRDGPACINVSEGFEGDIDPSGRRSAVNGWKVAALPWRQS